MLLVAIVQCSGIMAFLMSYHIVHAGLTNDEFRVYLSVIHITSFRSQRTTMYTTDVFYFSRSYFIPTEPDHDFVTISYCSVRTKTLAVSSLSKKLIKLSALPQWVGVLWKPRKKMPFIPTLQPFSTCSNGVVNVEEGILQLQQNATKLHFIAGTHSYVNGWECI